MSNAPAELKGVDSVELERALDCPPPKNAPNALPMLPELSIELAGGPDENIPAPPNIFPFDEVGIPAPAPALNENDGVELLLLA